MSKLITFSGIVLMFIFFSCADISKEKNTQNQSDQISDSTSLFDKQIIVDVRTPEEWIEDGHAVCTVNFPLDELTNHMDTLKQFQKIVLVCRSGNRAEQAKNMLESEGIQNIENLGSWTNIKCP
jgi:rhodanese-related sulfurtransferase